MTTPYAEWVRERICARKRRHGSHSAATEAMWSYALASGTDRSVLEVYACALCEGWHWGHTNPDPYLGWRCSTCGAPTIDAPCPEHGDRTRGDHMAATTALYAELTEESTP